METQPDALYAGLVGTLTSAVMNLPGEAYTLARKNKTGAVPGAQQSGNSAPRLFTRDEVQGLSAGEVSENYDAIRESMEMWDENGELQGGTQSRMVDRCALPGFVDSKNEEKTERNAGYLVVSQSGGGMLRQGTREGIRRTPANRGMRAHRIVKGLDISEDVCHGMCP